jgi:malate synthase
MNMPLVDQYKIQEEFLEFINSEVLSQTSLDPMNFWTGMVSILKDLTPTNEALLAKREALQQQLDEYYQEHGTVPDAEEYKQFLSDIGYLLEEGDDFVISPKNIDKEVAEISGPQLVVPVDNARFVLNAANARWGSLYDALYGTDVIPQTTGLKANGKYNPCRGREVINFAREFLDETFPLNHGSHKDVTGYSLYYQHLLAYFADGSCTGLAKPSQFVALSGQPTQPTSVVLNNNGLHVEIIINKSGVIGKDDMAGIDDIRVEAALTTIIDFEDSVAAVDAEDKIAAYKNWLGLIQRTLTAEFEKDGETIFREMNPDLSFTGKSDLEYKIKGTSLLLVRNVGHLMRTSLIIDYEGKECFEGLIDGVVTALIASLDLKTRHNSKQGSIYIVKPKMHGPEEVQFTCDLFSRIEELLELPKYTIKLGIMDEERRTTVNLKECIRVAKKRVFFINTGFLDRTGDEIHTSMEAGPFMPKAEIKTQPWINAYEQWNVDIGLETGFRGRAQIGKGMWAMPDEMAQMVKEKIGHPQAGADTAWVPSPTAATLHALHYHKINVDEVQAELKERPRASLDDILTIPLLKETLSTEQIEQELANNLQGILGYMVRWVELGIGCSKVPDINDIGLMEDRATLRISSQHIANWLRHKICTREQVLTIMARMAEVVDQQNARTPGYTPMTADLDASIAFQAAKELIFEGASQPSGYTEPVLHDYRLKSKR